MTIVVTGGSGFIGTKLTRALLAQNHTIIVVDINPPTFTHEKLFYIKCDLATQDLPYNVLDRTDAVINLVGSPILTKWTKESCFFIEQSRIESTKRIASSIVTAESRPTVFISASAIGFYGDTKEPVDEGGEHGEGFLAELAALWELEAREAVSSGVRVVCMRTAPVLGDGPFLEQMTKTARFGFLIKPTKENPWISWIHEDDIVNAYIFALETSTLQGVVNASAPESVPLHTFFKILSQAMRRKVVGSIPAWYMRMRYGTLNQELTMNKRVLPKRLIDKGFTFTYPTLKSALQALFKK